MSFDANNMKHNLTQFIYISRSTFLSIGSSKVEPEVAQILAESKTNNRKNGLVGVLFFGDGCFFECLEGEEKEIDALYQVLLKDTRHKDLKIISRKRIKQPSFQKWSMKYVHIDAGIRKLLKDNGFQLFDPYSFSEEMYAKLLELLLIADDESNISVSASIKKKLGKWAIYLPLIVITLYIMKLIINITSIK